MAKFLAVFGLLFGLSACDSYQGYGGYGAEIINNPTVRTATLGGLIGGATAYIVGEDPLLGAGIGAAAGAGIQYFEGN